MIAALIVGAAMVYALIAARVWGWMLRRQVRHYPTLPIDGTDVLFATFLALLWPAAVPFELIVYHDKGVAPSAVVRFARRVARQDGAS